MLVNFGNFILMLGTVWAVGEVLVQALKDKLKIDKMLYSVVVFVALGIFALVYDFVVNKVAVDGTYIMNAIVFVVFCAVIPMASYDIIVELIKRIVKK